MKENEITFTNLYTDITFSFLHDGKIFIKILDNLENDQVSIIILKSDAEKLRDMLIEQYKESPDGKE